MRKERVSLHLSDSGDFFLRKQALPSSYYALHRHAVAQVYAFIRLACFFDAVLQFPFKKCVSSIFPFDLTRWPRKDIIFQKGFERTSGGTVIDWSVMRVKRKLSPRSTSADLQGDTDKLRIISTLS